MDANSISSIIWQTLISMEKKLENPNQINRAKERKLNEIYSQYGKRDFFAVIEKLDDVEKSIVKSPLVYSIILMF
jgi:hypothetical protein